MKPEIEIEVELLARTDALFVPNRRGNRRAAVDQERRRFAKLGGLPLKTSAADRTYERRVQRAMELLVHRGRVVSRKTDAGRTVRVRLSEEADDEVRRLVGTAAGDVDSALATIEALEQLADSGECYSTGDGRRWVPETALAGIDYGLPDTAAELEIVQRLALAGLVRGWIESNADVDGRAFYATTPAGRDALSRWEPKSIDDDASRRDACAERRYLERFNAAYDDLDRLKVVRPGEIGPVPIPVAWRTLAV